MTKYKIFYGQKWVNDNSVVLCSSKNHHSNPSLPIYKYIEYTKEVEESLERIAELEQEIEELKEVAVIIDHQRDMERSIRYKAGMERAAEILIAIGYVENDAEIEAIRGEANEYGQSQQRIAKLEAANNEVNAQCMKEAARADELEHELEKCQFCYDKTLPLAERIAKLEDKLLDREAHWNRVHERKIIEHDLRHQENIAELKAERDRLREAIQPDDDCVLRKILLDVYGHTEGKEWKVMHRLKKALEEK